METGASRPCFVMSGLPQGQRAEPVAPGPEYLMM